MEITTDYRNYQASVYGKPIDPSIWSRTQLINGVRVDKFLSYKALLESSGKGYGFLRLFGGKNVNCAGAAAVGLLKSGVFNIPIAVPGLLSFQMYARQFSYLSYTISNY